ncbi:MAG: cytidylate kinase family protein [Candidatus Bathyarchaeia archaeon]
MKKTIKKPHRDSKKKLILCICGMAGCGKSTLARKIAEKYGLRYYSGGDALKALALEEGYKKVDRGWWESREGMKFLQKRAQDPSFDRKIDKKLLEWAEHGDVVLDSWTMPWLLKGGFKVWLEASQEERARRIAGRDRISVERAFAALKEKDAGTKGIFKRLYGFSLGEDFSPFDLILDVNQLAPDEVFHALVQVLDRMLYVSR